MTQGLDEAGLLAYSSHLQQEFLQPSVTSAKAATMKADAEDDESADEDEEPEEGPAPEDAARRWVTSMSFRDFPCCSPTLKFQSVVSCLLYYCVGELPWSLQMKVDT